MRAAPPHATCRSPASTKAQKTHRDLPAKPRNTESGDDSVPGASDPCVQPAMAEAPLILYIAAAGTPSQEAGRAAVALRRDELEFRRHRDLAGRVRQVCGRVAAPVCALRCPFALHHEGVWFYYRLVAQCHAV